jgi:hypothetical protein
LHFGSGQGFALDLDLFCVRGFQSESHPAIFLDFRKHRRLRKGREGKSQGGEQVK